MTIYEALIAHVEYRIKFAKQYLDAHKSNPTAQYEVDVRREITEADGAMQFFNYLRQLGVNGLSVDEAQRKTLDELEAQLSAIEDELREAIHR